MSIEATTAKSWYREPYLWLVILLPFSAVLGGLLTVYIAVTHQDSLVDDNYYQSGLAINKDKDSHLVAKSMRLTGQLVQNNGIFLLHLQSKEQTLQLPKVLQLKLNHPTDEHKDEVIQLLQTSIGYYQADFSKIISGRYYLHLQPIDASWLIQQSIELSPNKPVSIQAT